MWMLIAWLGLLHSSSVVRWPNICVMLCRMKACTQWGWMEAMSTEEFNLAIYMQLWKYMHLCEPSVGIKGVKRDSSVWKYTHLWVWCQTLDSLTSNPITNLSSSLSIYHLLRQKIRIGSELSLRLPFSFELWIMWICTSRDSAQMKML